VKGEHSEKYFALDDAARRKLGIPVVDKHRYSRENGWMISALATAYTVTGERAYLDDAQRAARWIVANRSITGGGFRHDERDVAGPYLEDTLAMGDAFLALYTATGSREWLGRAQSSAAFIEQHFRGTQPGYLTSAPRAGSRLQPKSNIDENIPLARFTNLLHRYTGAVSYRAMSDYALRMLVTEEVADSQITAPGILLAAFESVNDPLHITIVGGKDDAAAVALFDSALRYAAVYRRIEWWDRREGNMPNPDVRYPQLPRAAAFICTDSTCSLPIFDAAKVPNEVARSVRQVAKN
jgi:uncharacterized protein YyaL (SSP411 family)